MNHINEDRNHMECKLSNIILQSKYTHKRSCLYELLQQNKNSLICRNRCIWSRIGNWATADELSMRWSTTQQHTMTNCICQQKPIKSQKRYSNIEREEIGILYGLEKFQNYFCQRGRYNHRSQTTGNNLEEKHSNIITETSVYNIRNSPIQHQDPIQV